MRKIPIVVLVLAAVLFTAPSLYAQQVGAPSVSPPAGPAPEAPSPTLAGPRPSSLNITAQPLPGTPTAAPATTPAPPTISQPQMEVLQRLLSPSQQQAIQAEMDKTGGQLTPEALEALKSKPEFKGLSPEEVAKGKQMLQQKDTAAEQKHAETKTPFEGEKREISSETTREANLFDRFRTVGKYQDISLNLRPFGYEFFSQAAVRVLTDRKDIPVPLKYVIGPGDEVRLLLWGRVNAQYNLTVDRDGRITIPQIGPLYVAGMTFEEMSKYIIKQSEQIVGTNVDISMGALKTIQVFILGDVVRPGPYTIGSFATITDALLMAGGPTVIGSMRNVQLRRKGQLVTTFDLYDLLLKGDKSKDMTLLAGDVVFVPVTGPLVGIAGNVKRPAIYELRSHFDLQALIDLAGGIIPTAYTQQIQVERIVKNERHIVVDIDDKNLAKTGEIKLQEGDLVKIFPIVDRNVNVIYLNGNVKRPGKYEIKTAMRLGDILKTPEDLLPETYFDYGLIKRLVPPEMKTVLVPFNLGAILLKKDPAADIALAPQDQIFIFHKSFFKERPFFIVEGQVRKEGKYGLDENFRVKDAILAAGGLTRDAYPDRGVIIRRDKDRQYHAIYFHVANALEGASSDNLLLQDEDRIVIHSIWEYKYKKQVTVEGDVAKPGTYELTEGMTVRDIVFRAGNILESAYLEEAELSSLTFEDRKATKTDYRVINLRKALDGDPTHNVLLKPYDHLFVKRIPNWGERYYVTLSGEFRFPGRYAIRKGERLSSVIERAGGYLPTAHLRGAYFTREKVREIQQKSLEDMSKRMERELLSEGAIKIASSLSAEEVSAKNQEVQMKRKLIDYIRSLKATGRMNISLAHLRLLKGSHYDIELEDGDTLHLPTKNNVINVVGAVMAEGSHIYDERLTYMDYIDRSGGFTRYADEGNVFVVKVDGTARRLAQGFTDWNDKHERWELTSFGSETKKIEPGDIIVVPEKVSSIAWLRDIRDITQILMNTAVTAATIIKLW